MDQIIFYIIALSTCVCALLAVTSRNIFHGAVWLSLCLLSISGLYFYLNAAFVGVIQVLVYIGGIISLFIFAIKLTAKIDDTSVRQTSDHVVLSGMAAFILLVFLLKALSASYKITLPSPEKTLSLKELGESLLTTYVLPFEFISLILLAAMIGAIVIGKEKK